MIFPTDNGFTRYGIVYRNSAVLSLSSFDIIVAPQHYRMSKATMMYHKYIPKHSNRGVGGNTRAECPCRILLLQCGHCIHHRHNRPEFSTTVPHSAAPIATMNSIPNIHIERPFSVCF